MIEFTISREPAGNDDVERVERHIGMLLPADYRQFLLRQDGGRVAVNSAALHSILGVSADAPRWVSFWWKVEIFHDRIPSWSLPVAQDEYGNLFLISLRRSDFGSVWFWDHEEEADEGDPPSESNIEQMANSWTEFAEGICV